MHRILAILAAGLVLLSTAQPAPAGAGGPQSKRSHHPRPQPHRLHRPGRRSPARSGDVSTYDALVLGEQPAGLWEMGSSAPTEPDASGHGHPGRYLGSHSGAATMPDGERAATFDGDGEYLAIPSSAVFSITKTGELTWEGWIRPATLQWSRNSDPSHGGYVDWLGKCQNYSPTCEWEARFYSAVNAQGRCDRLSAYAFNPGAGLGSGAYWQPGCGELSAGRWLYVVGEYQTHSTPAACGTGTAGTISIWVDGVPWDSAKNVPTGCMSQYRVTPRSEDSPVDVGTMARDTWFDGAIGQVAIYDYLLSGAQIAAHYRAMTGVAPAGSCAATCTL